MIYIYIYIYYVYIYIYIYIYTERAILTSTCPILSQPKPS